MTSTLATGTEPPAGVDYGAFEFSVKRFTLHTMAKWVAAAVPSHSTLPVYGCFRVDVSPDRVRLAATDMEISVIAESLAVAAPGGEASVFIPAKKLDALLDEAPEGDIHIAVKKNLATVTASGGASWVLRLPDPAGYPALPEPDSDVIEFRPVNREAFLAALRIVRHAVCRDNGQPAYTQVRIADAGDGMAATASDSNQFARAPLPGFPAAMSIPAAGLDHLAKLLAATPVENAEVGETAEALLFRVGPVVLAVKRLQAVFPDIERLMLRPARENSGVLTVDRGELQAAIRRVRITADDSTSAIALVTGEGTLSVVSRDKNQNSCEETIHASWDGPGRVVVVNHRFLSDMLAVHPSQSCEFRLGKDVGKRRAPVLLADAESGVTGVIPAMPAVLVGY